MKALEILAALLAGLGALAGQATESLSPLLAGLAMAAPCALVVKLNRRLQA